MGVRHARRAFGALRRQGVCNGYLLPGVLVGGASASIMYLAVDHDTFSIFAFAALSRLEQHR